MKLKRMMSKEEYEARLNRVLELPDFSNIVKEVEALIIQNSNLIAAQIAIGSSATIVRSGGILKCIAPFNVYIEVPDETKS